MQLSGCSAAPDPKSRFTPGNWPPTVWICLSAGLLLWPALLNGYPLVFSDTGTYLGQAIEHHLGWDRPVSYSFFLLAVHWTRTTWPAVIAQTLLTAHILYLVRRCLLGRRNSWRLLPVTLVLAIGSSLPWFATQLMPDIFTPLLALTLTLLILVPERLNQRERVWLSLFATFMIAVHQANLPLSIGMMAVLLPLRWRLGAEAPLGRIGLGRVVLPPVVAAAALAGANFIGHGRLAISLYGNVFFLVRTIYDGPGMHALDHACPDSGWRLCILTHTPLPEFADDFLWSPTSPLVLAGGPVAVSKEAGAIIETALHREPFAMLSAAAYNTVRQFHLAYTGDGLNAWPGR
jgi:hypothetical protein